VNARQLFNVLWRLKWSTTLLFAVLAGVGIAMVSLLPATWSSSSRIAIERPDSAISDVRQNAQELLYERVEFLKASILSPTSIDQLALKLELAAEDTEAVRAELTDRLEIEVENVSVVNRYTGKLGLLPLAITVRYEGRSAEQAYAVTQAVTDQVLAESRGRDAESGRYRASFLDQEVAKASAQLVAIETQIAEFKTRNALLMPELHDLYIRQLEENRGVLARSRENLAEIERNAAQTEAELAVTSRDVLLVADDGTRIESANERLERARVALASARARYSNDHPEVRALERDFNALAAVAEGVDTITLERELYTTTESLSEAQTRYTTSHPTVLRLERRVQELQSMLRVAQNAGPTLASTSVPSSPAYNRLIAKRESVAENISIERSRARELEDEARTLNERFALMPAVERQYLVLERQLEDARLMYAERQEARSSSALESGLRDAALLETLTLVTAPEVSTSPVAPNRQFLSAFAVFFALLAAVTFTLARILLGDRIYELDSAWPAPHNASVHTIPTF